jgi:hypothetical protein
MHREFQDAGTAEGSGQAVERNKKRNPCTIKIYICRSPSINRLHNIVKILSILWLDPV